MRPLLHWIGVGVALTIVALIVTVLVRNVYFVSKNLFPNDPD